MLKAAVVSIMKNENFLNIMKYAPNLYNTLKKLAIMDGVIHEEVEGKNENGENANTERHKVIDP